MLTICPECELQVSDKALTCPHCGYPLKGSSKKTTTRKSGKRRRLPNGFGQISEIKGRYLRKPFRAMVTVGKNEFGRPICKPLKPDAYFETYNEAYAALVEYNKNPYDLSPAITMAELYEKWSKEHFKTYRSNGTIAAMESAWKYCSSVYKMRAIELRARHIKKCIEEGTAIIRGQEKHPSAITKNRIKTLFNQMLDYAVEYELIDRNYSRTFNLSDEVIKEVTTVKRGHIAFTDEEMQLLWDNVEEKHFVDIMLIQCYSGWRPQELGLLKLENVNLDEWTFQGGMKTDAGTNRIVPIHSRIRELVRRRYSQALNLDSKYLFNCTDGKKITPLIYNRYQAGFNRIIEELKLNPMHRPHDGRTHFVTMAKKYGVDEYAIKYIVGHKISDITEKVYTKREFDWLRKEMEKIK